MKVLMVTCWYPSSANFHSGIFVHEHAKAVQKIGVDVKVLHVWPVKNSDFWYNPESEVHMEDGIEVHSKLIHSKIPGLAYNLWPVLRMEAEKMMPQIVSGEWQPDILHAHVLYPAGFITRSLARKMKTSYVITEHWSKLHWVFNRPIYKGYGRKVYREASSVHPVSDYLATRVSHYCPEVSNMQVIPNVVDSTLFFRPESSDDAVKKEYKQLLCVTKFTTAKYNPKRPEILLEAFIRLKKEYRQKLKLIFAGPGKKQTDLKNRIKNLGLDHQVVFLGAQPKLEIAGQMKASDFLLHPTDKETFGVVVSEALSCGLPCIVSDVPALKELVDEDSGVIVESNTVGSWINVLQRIAEDQFEFDRTRIADRNADKYSYKTVGNAFFKSYRKALQQSK